jgi:Domain of unknown function (DUF4276)
MVAVRIFVEGGGDRKDQQTRCREGFRRLLERVVPKGAQPKIIACGSRNAAFESFRRAFESPEPGTAYLLLVDAEEVVAGDRRPWKHLEQRDGWARPAGSGDDSVHLMTVATETWLIADPDALSGHYGDGFNRKALPRADGLEGVSKRDVNEALGSATRGTKKGKYQHSHGWELVGKVSPDAIRVRCPRFGKRFLDHVAKLSRG